MAEIWQLHTSKTTSKMVAVRHIKFPITLITKFTDERTTDQGWRMIWTALHQMMVDQNITVTIQTFWWRYHFRRCVELDPCHTKWNVRIHVFHSRRPFLGPTEPSSTQWPITAFLHVNDFFSGWWVWPGWFCSNPGRQFPSICRQLYTGSITAPCRLVIIPICSVKSLDWSSLFPEWTASCWISHVFSLLVHIGVKKALCRNVVVLHWRRMVSFRPFSLTYKNIRNKTEINQMSVFFYKIKIGQLWCVHTPVSVEHSPVLEEE